MPEKKFKRDGKPQHDARGRIVVRVSLAKAKKYTPLRDNLIKVLAVQDATVTEVFQAIEKALFEPR